MRLKNTFFTLFFAILAFAAQAQTEQEAEESTSEQTEKSAQTTEASPASLYNDGLAALKAKEYQTAFDMMTQAIANSESEEDKVAKLAKRNGSIAAYYLGNDYRKNEDNAEKALEIYQKGIELNPDFYANYIGVAQAQEDLGDPSASMEAYINAAEAAGKADKADKAESLINKAENIVGQAYSNEDWQQTVDLGTAYLEVQESAEAHYYMARAYSKLRKYNDAVSHADKAIAMGGKDKYWFAKGEAFESAGNNSAAVEAYKNVKGGIFAEQAKYKVGQLE